MLSNRTNTPVQVYIEPWGMDHTLLPGLSICVIATSEQAGKLEVIEEEQRLTVYGWEGSTVEVFGDGQLLLDFPTPVPMLPRGMLSRSFIEMMFGKGTFAP